MQSTVGSESITNAVSCVFKQITVSGVSGALAGTIYAELYNKSKPAYAFSIGMKWTMVAIPFFTIRKLIFHNDYQLTSSFVSGAIVGCGIGMIWRGPRAILPIAVLHGFVGLGGQFVVNMVDKFRYSVAIKKLESLNMIEIPKQMEYKNRNEQVVKEDPIKLIFNRVRDVVLNAVGVENIPDCIIYATDIEYRKKQLLKIGILRTQIYDLKKELENKNIEY